MKQRSPLTALLLAGFIIPLNSGVVTAQAPLIQRDVSMAMAQMIIAGALEHCSKDGFNVSIVIVDYAGQVSAAVRGDHTNPHNFDLARRKAYTARTRNMSSAEFAKLAATSQGAALKEIPDTVAVAGGLPIRFGDEAIGAVGVSGAPTGDKDATCAQAGLAKVADFLK